jgi:subtilisin-like proprotein convertase family protein
MQTSVAVLLLHFAAIAAGASNDKAEIRERMLAAHARIAELRANGGSEVEIARLRGECDELSARLGGGRVRAPQAMSCATPVSAAQNLVTSPPPGSTASTASFTNATPQAIPDLATITSSLAVSGVGSYLWDVDLTTDITHTWCGDIDMYLIAPSGKRVTVATDIAEGYLHVFSGTLWDDSAGNPAWDYPHSDFVTSTPLTPEGKLHRLAGDDPNGTWTLEITDDAAADIGVLHAWTLELTTFAAAPIAGGAPATFASAPGLAIADNATVSDLILASGLGTELAEARVRVEITHTYNADLIFEVLAPNGQRVRLSTYNGAENDDVFDGTSFFDVMSQTMPVVDPLLDQPIDEYPFADGVAATQGQPEGSFSALLGSDPNGAWQLEITDTATADVGTLVRWELSLATYASAAPASYCTAGTTTNGCLALITASANPSVSYANACHVSVAGVEGQKNAILFYGLAANALPWAPGSGSYLCVKAPTQRTGGQASGGTFGACDGALALDWNAYQQANPAALGTPWVVGERAFVQAWFRDPPAPKTTNLSDGLELTYQP